MKRPVKTKPAALRSQKTVGRRTLRKLKPVYRRKFWRSILFSKMKQELFPRMTVYIQMKDGPQRKYLKEQIRTIAKKQIVKHFGLQRYLKLYKRIVVKKAKNRINKRETRKLIKSLQLKIEELDGTKFKQQIKELLDSSSTEREVTFANDFVHHLIESLSVFRTQLMTIKLKLENS